MANRNKNKGKSFERQIAKFLTEIYGVSFQRVPNSGAYVGGMNSKRYETLTNEQKLLADGDLIVPSFLSHISFECKSYKDFSFSSLYCGKCALLDGWIEQASSTKKPFWILFFKINNKGTYVVYKKNISPNINSNDSKMFYKNEYVIELAEHFMINNKETLKDLNKL
jgi:hypothetical protein